MNGKDEDVSRRANRTIIAGTRKTAWRVRIASHCGFATHTQWLDNPDTLENNGARFIRWTMKPGQHVCPYDCDPSFAAEYQQMESPPAK